MDRPPAPPPAPPTLVRRGSPSPPGHIVCVWLREGTDWQVLLSFFAGCVLGAWTLACLLALLTEASRPTGHLAEGLRLIVLPALLYSLNSCWHPVWRICWGREGYLDAGWDELLGFPEWLCAAAGLPGWLAVWLYDRR